MAIQKYYDASQFGTQVTPQGNIPTLYGMPIYVTPQVPNDAQGSGGKASLLVHREAVAFALANNGLGQSGVALTEKDSGEYLRTKFIADIMYGVKALRTKAGVVIKGSN